MAVVFEKPSLAQRFLPLFRGFDLPLMLVVALLACAGLVAMYSSGYDHGTRFSDHGRNMLIAGAILFMVAQVPPQKIMLFAVPLYAAGVALLLAVALFGITKKGATRWINVGIVIQPSEILKIAMPLMLAWWFQKREGTLRPLDFAAAGLLLAVPVGLIMKQPDLGTSLLVLAAGLSVIFFAGLSWKLVLPPVVMGYALLVTLGTQGAVGAFLKEHLGLVFAFRWTGAALASAIMGFPLLVRTIRLSIENVDRRLEQAAATLGASPLRVFCTITLPLAWPFQASLHDLSLLALLGVVQLAIPCVLAVRCGRVLKAPEMALLGLLEVIFGILLAWLGAGEKPAPAVLTGGVLVIGALVFNELLGWKEQK